MMCRTVWIGIMTIIDVRFAFCGMAPPIRATGVSNSRTTLLVVQVAQSINDAQDPIIEHEESKKRI